MKQIEEHLPTSLIRLGLLIALACIGIFVFISWLLEYKDTIDGRILITTPTLPIDVHANSSGKLLLLKDNHVLVKKGEPLAYIENAAQLAPCLRLLKELDSISLNQLLQISPPPFLSELTDAELGNIQSSYIALQKTYRDYAFFLKHDNHREIIRQKEEQIQLHQNHIGLSEENIVLHQQNLEKVEQQLEDYEKLYEKGAVPKKDLDVVQRDFDELKFTGRLIDFQTAISNAKIQKTQQQEAIIKLKNDFIQEKEQLKNQIFNALQHLKKETINWQEQYLIIADIDGQVVYSEVLTDFNYVPKGSQIMTILPENAEPFMGLVRVPLGGYAKVAIGQPVQVRLDNYPFQEFGILNGEVTNLSSMPEKETYLVKVSFPEKFLSSYSLHLNINQRMEGQAAIITNRISLWQRLKNQINSARLNN